uniref:TOG domain-containing protein n=1 Tax=Araucaria cunninghamii TaxID=56994 RepID=A0A0D6QUI9_ARACU
MSGKALRDLNASPLDRKTSSSSKGSIGKALSGNNNENINMQNSKNLNQDSIALRASSEAKPMDGGPGLVCPEVEYIESENLQDLEDMDGHLATLLDRLDSKDWLMVCEALNHLRQLSIFHKEAILQILPNVVTLIVKSVKNPRSALCKTAIMASSDLFKAYQDQMMDFLDPLLLQLLLKASQDKRFVCEAAEKALIMMTTCISPNLLLHKLQPYVKNKNPRIRAKATMCVCRSVQRLGMEGIKDYGLDTLIQTAALQLSDQLPEAREAARILSLELRAVYDKYAFDHQTQDVSQPTSKNDAWEQFCCMKLSPSHAQAVLRVTLAAT